MKYQDIQIIGSYFYSNQITRYHIIGFVLKTNELQCSTEAFPLVVCPVRPINGLAPGQHLTCNFGWTNLIRSFVLWDAGSCRSHLIVNLPRVSVTLFLFDHPVFVQPVFTYYWSVWGKGKHIDIVYLQSALAFTLELFIILLLQSSYGICDVLTAIPLQICWLGCGLT